MTWFDELGFNKNPLDIRPNADLVGLEKEEKQLINHIQKEEICFLNGLTGTGKTSLLLKVQDALHDYNFIYLDSQELPNDFNLEKELMDSKGFFDRLFMRKYPKKKPVLIIDEFQATDINLVLEARAGWENQVERKIKSIVIAQISKYLRNVTPAFKERLGSRIITLRPLDSEEMKEIIRKRLNNERIGINYIDKISDEALDFLVKCSGSNPRRLLEYTDELFDFHHTKFGENNPILRKDYKISYHGAKEILGLEKVKVEGFENLPPVEENNSEIDTAKFEKMFNIKERKILRFLSDKPVTATEIAEKLEISLSNASALIGALRVKRAIIFAGKKKRKKQWQIAPDIKRIMVKV